MATGRLVGKTCVITGAAHGIAKATAQLFVAEGASVLLADRDAVAGERVAWLLREQGATAQFVETDVSDEIAVGRMIDAGRDLGGGKVFPSVHIPLLLCRLFSRHAPSIIPPLRLSRTTLAHITSVPSPCPTSRTIKIHGLVNVAGVDIIAKLEDHTAARWDRVMDVNLKSVFLTCRAALPSLRAAGHSAIVNISSIQAARGFRCAASFRSFLSSFQIEILHCCFPLLSSHTHSNICTDGLAVAPHGCVE